jgi:hypothetical protein
VALRWLLKETGIEAIITGYSSALFTDSTVAKAMAFNYCMSDKAKHIAIMYRFICELIAQGVISVLKVDTKLTPADGGTKVLGLQVFPGIADRMMGRVAVVQPQRRMATIKYDDFP